MNDISKNIQEEDVEENSTDTALSDQVAPEEPSSNWITAVFLPFIKKYLWKFAVPLIALFLLFSLILKLEPANVLVSAVLKTETIDITVTNPDKMKLVLPRGLVETEAGSVCLTNITLLTMQAGHLIYTLLQGNGLAIATTGETRWIADETQGEMQSQDGVLISIMPNGECNWNGLMRLPVVGKIEAGDVASGDLTQDNFKPLLSGVLTIQGRAVEKVFGFISLSSFSFLPFEPGKLFNAGKFEIPAGSKLVGKDARFFGFLEIDITKNPHDRNAMRVTASSNTKELFVIAPAPRTASSQNSEPSTLTADTISMTFGTRLLGDPNLHLIFGGLSAILLLIGAIGRIAREESR